jgi:hypothetical protein
MGHHWNLHAISALYRPNFGSENIRLGDDGQLRFNAILTDHLLRLFINRVWVDQGSLQSSTNGGYCEFKELPGTYCWCCGGICWNRK